MKKAPLLISLAAAGVMAIGAAPAVFALNNEVAGSAANSSSPSVTMTETNSTTGYGSLSTNNSTMQSGGTGAMSDSSGMHSGFNRMNAYNDFMSNSQYGSDLSNMTITRENVSDVLLKIAMFLEQDQMNQTSTMGTDNLNNSASGTSRINTTGIATDTNNINNSNTAHRSNRSTLNNTTDRVAGDTNDTNDTARYNNRMRGTNRMSNRSANYNDNYNGLRNNSDLNNARINGNLNDNTRTGLTTADRASINNRRGTTGTHNTTDMNTASGTQNITGINTASGTQNTTSINTASGVQNTTGINTASGVQNTTGINTTSGAQNTTDMNTISGTQGGTQQQNNNMLLRSGMSSMNSDIYSRIENFRNDSTGNKVVLLAEILPLE